MMKITLVTAPTVEPLTRAAVKNHLRIEHDDDGHNGRIDDLIKATREYAENYTGRSLCNRTYDYWIDRWPSGDAIELPRPPLVSVTSISYTKWDGSSASLTENTDFVVDADSTFGRVVLEYAKTWPTDELHPSNPIKIRFVAGYGDGGSSPADYRADVPHVIKQAMYLMIGHWFEHREASVVGVNIARVPAGAEALLDMERIRSF
jgi:uncharacterized phiE125 gp8 family phage protein